MWVLQAPSCVQELRYLWFGFFVSPLKNLGLSLFISLTVVDIKVSDFLNEYFEILPIMTLN